MRKLLGTVALAAMMVAIAARAEAKSVDGWYVRGDIGYSVDANAEVKYPSDMGYDDEESSYSIPGYTSSVEFDDDFLGGAGFGYDYANGWRTELEAFYRTNEASSYYGSESIDALSAMVNIFYDFLPDTSFQPYVGVGLGVANVEPDSGPDDTAFAWQALVGFGMPISERLTFDAAYRYFRADELDFSPVEADYEHQAITVGLRYALAAPPPPPPPPPPPVEPPPPPPPPVVACPQSNFTVYFEWDRSNLTPEAVETLDAAAARARECNISGITVVGHTDASGSNQYNVALSERRSSVVGDALVARGLPGALMQLQAMGETQLAVPTRDGVREPQNRRSAVTISFK